MSKMRARPRVMVVEDEWILTMDLKLLLNSMGCDVVTSATTGDEVLQQLETTHVDLLMMDITIKGDKDGIDTYRQVKEKYNIPVIYLTGNADEGTLKRARETEPVGIIIKPVEEKELLTLLTSLLAELSGNS